MAAKMMFLYNIELKKEYNKSIWKIWFLQSSKYLAKIKVGSRSGPKWRLAVVQNPGSGILPDTWMTEVPDFVIHGRGLVDGLWGWVRGPGHALHHVVMVTQLHPAHTHAHTCDSVSPVVTDNCWWMELVVRINWIFFFKPLRSPLQPTSQKLKKT